MLKKVFKFFGLLVLITVAISCSKEEENAANNTALDVDPLLTAVVELDVSYGDNSQQTYDLYLPADRSETTTKVIVLVHGGGWTSGDKADMNNFVDFIKEQLPEYAIVNINYVLANINTPAFPNQFLDLKAVLNQIEEQASALKIKPEFALIGTSAGAHLSLMYDYVYDTNDTVKMVCSIVGPTDFTDPFYSNDPGFNFALNQLVDQSAYQEGADYASLVSPALQVSQSSSPSILFYGNTDPLVPISNGLSLESALANQNISHSFTIYEGGHGDDWNTADYNNLQAQLLDYLAIYLPIE